MGNKKFCWYTKNKQTRTFSKETHESNFMLYSYCVTVGKSEVTCGPAESDNVYHSSGLTSIQLKSHRISHSLCWSESPVSHVQTHIIYVWTDSGKCVENILWEEDLTIICLYRESSYVQHVGLPLKQCACYSVWNACRECLLTHIYSMTA